VLYTFTGDFGSDPETGLIFDAAGNLYVYGTDTDDTAFMLTPNADGSWTASLLYKFCSLVFCPDGELPWGLVFDAVGNLYGTTSYGGVSDNCPHQYGGCGTVFKLTPNADGSCTENILHDFANRPSTNPFAGVIFDGAGNLYGTTVSGGPGGTVFRMTPNSDGSWKYSLLHVFMGKPALNPVSSPVLDKAGNLYGTTAGCGSGYKCKGVVFEITP
jgi:uncharacterized repeat protein (TIGR03803 family)